MTNEVYAMSRQVMSDAKFYLDYSRWMDTENRYETWNDSVKRVMNMHREKYKDIMCVELAALIDYAEQAYMEQLVLGSQRALQFGGEQIFKNNIRLYNCAFSYTDRPRFFQEAMLILLAGCGVGFSVQKHHIAKLPDIKKPSRRAQIHVVNDSIEGWADAFGVLLSSYFDRDDVPFPEYRNKTVYFDYSEIRPKGAYISGGFQAPGPDGLEESIDKCRKLLDRCIAAGQTRLRAIDAYDFVMHMSDAVLSGGVRRSAALCIFSKDDEEMLKAKTGNWYNENPQRARSNNSVMLVRDQLNRDEWAGIMKSVRDFGEPGFIFAHDTECGFNPCVEIGLRGYTEDGRSGWQFCNLTEQAGGKIKDTNTFMRSAKAAAIIATLQAGYTDFPYLGEATEEITKREALIGCSITGWMNSPDVLFDEGNMRQAAQMVKKINAKVAALLGINAAARTTTSKPSGNASVILQCESGISGAHAPRYIRNAQMNSQTPVVQFLKESNPKMVSKYLGNKTDSIVSFPIVIDDVNAIYRDQLLNSVHLEYVKKAQQIWIEEGTNVDLCVDKQIRHNISNTINVTNWDEVEEYIYNNRQFFAGISLLSATGDKDYNQAPFTQVFTEDELVNEYGSAAIFASGLIVDALHAFNDDLWNACTCALYSKEFEEGTPNLVLKKDWLRRINKFAVNYFSGDVKKTTYCLKDVHNLHKWEAIVRDFKVPDFSTLPPKEYVKVDTMGASACAGGVCALSF